MSSELATAVADLEEQQVLALVAEQLETGKDPLGILDACRQGMDLVGQRYEQGDYFLSDLIMAGEIFRKAGNIVTPKLGGAARASKGRVVIGTAKGDIHDIGKNIVITMLKGANYEVFDLGVDVPPARFVEAVKETGASILGISGLLTISFDPMKDTVAALNAAGLRSKVKVMVGGGPVTEGVQRYVGADGFGRAANDPVRLCNEWTKGALS